MKLDEIVTALRCISTAGDKEQHCESCPFYKTEKLDAQWAEIFGTDEDTICDCDAVGLAAADALEKLLDRCARYAEEIAVLQERLKAYEDTGLAPVICANYKAFEDEAISKGVTFKRIVALMEADKEGRVVVLPCQSGEHVFALLDDKTHVWECEVAHAVLDGWRKVFSIRPVGRTKEAYYAPFGAFGKTVFLTREEAEEALRRAEDA